METGCQQMLFGFQELGKRKVVAEFNGGTMCLIKKLNEQYRKC